MLQNTIQIYKLYTDSEIQIIVVPPYSIYESTLMRSWYNRGTVTSSCIAISGAEAQLFET